MICFAGELEIQSSFNGEMSLSNEMNGELGVIELVPDQERQTYTGGYEVTPKALEDQILPTSGKVMAQDVTVFKIPYFETSNAFGNTVIIGD